MKQANDSEGDFAVPESTHADSGPIPVLYPEKAEIRK